MALSSHKTKIVATIGPASDSPEMLERLILAGLNVARLNFSHGDFAEHGERIARIRAVAQATGHRVAIMADLPGPKMRIGRIEPEPVELMSGDPFTLMMLALPMLFLYFVAILIGWLVLRKRPETA